MTQCVDAPFINDFVLEPCASVAIVLSGVNLLELDSYEIFVFSLSIKCSPERLLQTGMKYT